jgi:hypothetical protein
MKDIIEILANYINTTFEDEEGLPTKIETSEGAPMHRIRDFEKRKKIALPRDLMRLLMFSNGINIFGISILPLNEMDYDQGLLTFHNWGNGDFDCISLEQNNEFGSVFFMNHSPDYIYFVCHSINEWIINAIQEIQKRGTLFHPMDYNDSEDYGLYKNISKNKLH